MAQGSERNARTEQVEILISGAHPELREWVQSGLEGVPHRVFEVAGLSAEPSVADFDPDLALVHEEEGAEFVTRLGGFKQRHPRCQVLLVGLHDSMLNPRRLGAGVVRHWFFRPIEVETLRSTLRAAGRSLSQTQRELERHSRSLVRLDAFLGTSPALQETLGLARRIAQSPTTPVLILGETGTGKELLARALHGESPLRDGPLVEINCGAIAPDLIESELFGHMRGAFTSATKDKPGLLELADGGTVFLDEVGELIPSAQVKMLKFLDDGTLRRLAASASLQVKARVIAATNRDLEEEVRTGRFRLDLFHRLGVVTLRLPPLRERREDIPILARHYLEQFTRERHGGAITWGDDAMEVLTAYDWPGNVRELANLTERLVLLSAQGGEIRAGDLPAGMSRRPKLVQFDPSRSEVQVELPPHGVNFDAVEKAVLEAALKMAKGNVTRAAALLGMGRGGLRYRLERLQITVGVSRRRGRPMGRRRPRAA